MEVALLNTSAVNKYRVRELAKDFGMSNKDVMEILGKYGEAPKSNMQALTDEQLSLVFESLTQTHPASGIEEIFADTYREPKKQEQPAPAPAAQQPAQQKTAAAQQSAPAAQAAPAKQGAAPANKPALAQPTTRVPQKKVVDTRKGGDVNLAKYDERLEQMAPEKAKRMQAPSGNRQKFHNNNSNRRPGPGGQFSNKRRQDEQERMRRLQLEIAKKAPLKVSIPDEISVGELASRMKKTGAEVVKVLMKNGIMASLPQIIDYDTAALVAMEFNCKVEH